MVVGSVVRMNRSKEMFEPVVQALEDAGVEPGELARSESFAAAVSAILRPCSSVPVRKRTSKPSSRLNRAIASVAIFS